MSEIFSPGSHRAASQSTGNDFGSADDNPGFPTRRMRRVHQDPISFAGQGEALTVQPQLTRRARREEPNGRKEYEDQLVRDYFGAEQGVERAPRDPGKLSRGEERALLSDNAGRSFPVQSGPGGSAPYPGRWQGSAPPGKAPREQERFEEFLRGRQYGRQAFESRQSTFEQSRQSDVTAKNSGYPTIQDRWSAPGRDLYNDKDDDLTGYLPGKQKVFVDPTASDNLAMVQPSGYVPNPGQPGPGMKPTAHIPVITANQSIVRNPADQPASYQAQPLRGLSSRSSLLARAEQIAAGAVYEPGDTIGANNSVNARLLQEQQVTAGAEQAQYPRGYAAYPSDSQIDGRNTGTYHTVNGVYMTGSIPSYNQTGMLPYQYPNGGEHNPPLASGEARGLQPINTRIAGMKSRVEKIATIAVTAGICLVFSAVVISIFFMK